MCRSNELGGRRCPLHSNPTYIANRNERRRAQYAKNKGSKVRDYNKKTEASFTLGNQKDYSFKGEWSPQQIAFFTNMNLVLDRPAENNNSFDSLLSIDHNETTKMDEKLDITFTPLQGYLVENELISSQEIGGKINYSNLDEKSYQKFGFSDKPDLSSSSFKQREHLENQAYAETDSLTELESETVALFGNDFGCSFVNDALYDTSKYDSLKTSDTENVFENTPETYRDLYNRGNLNSKFEPYDYEKRADLELNSRKLTKSAWQNTVNNLDSALQKGSGFQRIVHRGLSKKAAKAFEKRVGKLADLKLGQEMVFDGFQSTSFDALEARNRSDEIGLGGNVSFEILTPEGVQISKSSPYPMESEVVLPRGARYMLVGKQVHPPRFQGRKSVQVLQLVAINDEGEILTSSNRIKAATPVK